MMVTIVCRSHSEKWKISGSQTTVFDSQPCIPSMQYLPHCQFQLRAHWALNRYGWFTDVIATRDYQIVSCRFSHYIS